MTKFCKIHVKLRSDLELVQYRCRLEKNLTERGYLTAREKKEFYNVREEISSRRISDAWIMRNFPSLLPSPDLALPVATEMFEPAD